MRSSPTLALVTGLPGTGKSSVAAVAAEVFACAVLAHDWVMSGLRTYPNIQKALDELEHGHREVGWSIMLALARGQLVEDRSVVLDGVARFLQVEQCKAVAKDTDSKLVVISTECSDKALHRSRRENRRRLIPNWYELRWEDVERSMSTWESPTGDLHIDTCRPWDGNELSLRRFLASQWD